MWHVDNVNSVLETGAVCLSTLQLFTESHMFKLKTIHHQPSGCGRSTVLHQILAKFCTRIYTKTWLHVYNKVLHPEKTHLTQEFITSGVTTENHLPPSHSISPALTPTISMSIFPEVFLLSSCLSTPSLTSFIQKYPSLLNTRPNHLILSVSITWCPSCSTVTVPLICLVLILSTLVTPSGNLSIFISYIMHRSFSEKLISTSVSFVWHYLQFLTYETPRLFCFVSSYKSFLSSLIPLFVFNLENTSKMISLIVMLSSTVCPDALNLNYPVNVGEREGVRVYPFSIWSRSELLRWQCWRCRADHRGPVLLYKPGWSQPSTVTITLY